MVPTFQRNCLKFFSEDAYIECKGHVLNAIYSTLLQNEGSGYFDAKNHILLIMDINDTISEAMQNVKLDNEDLKQRHTELSMLDDEQNMRNAMKEQGIDREAPIAEVENEAPKGPTNHEIVMQIQDLMNQLKLA